MDCSYGGVAPFMRNMHKYFAEEFEVEYFYLPKPQSLSILPGRIKLMLYLWRNRDRLKSCDFLLSHVPEGSYVSSYMGKPYAHIYHGNDNPMTQSRYKLGIYFAPLFEMFFKRIRRTASIEYTVGPVIEGRKKLFNPIYHNLQPLPVNERSGFIFAGRLELIKNIDRLISIYSKMPEEVKEQNHFYIAGYGTQEQQLKALVQQLGLQQYIHFLGNLPNLQLIEEDRGKKILIMASTQEGMPTAIAEALSVGVPVVTTNPGDIGLVIKDGYNGHIFPLQFDDNDYISAVMDILSNYEQYSKNALESSYIFDSKNITNQVIKDINRVLDGTC